MFTNYHLDRVEGNINVFLDGEGGGKITSELHDTCHFCGEAHCYHSCDQSVAVFEGGSDETQSDEEVDARKRYNHCIDGLEAVIFNVALAGVQIDTPNFQKGVQAALDALDNFM